MDKTNYYFEDTGEHAMSAFVVSCRSCGMKTAQYRTEDSAIKRWNRRAERTCRYVGDEISGGCSECRGWLDPACSYCPNCGARVVSER